MAATYKDPSSVGLGAEDENTGWVCVWMEVMEHVRKASLAKYRESYTNCMHLK